MCRLSRARNCKRHRDHSRYLPFGTITHREPALAAVKAVFVDRHTDPHTALLVGAGLSEALNLAVVINTVELEHRQFDGLVDVLHLLRLSVVLLLALLTSASQTKHLVPYHV